MNSKQSQIIELYQKGLLSGGVAMQLCGVDDRPAFWNLLNEVGAYLNYYNEELDRDLQAVPLDVFLNFTLADFRAFVGENMKIKKWRQCTRRRQKKTMTALEALTDIYNTAPDPQAQNIRDCLSLTPLGYTDRSILDGRLSEERDGWVESQKTATESIPDVAGCLAKYAECPAVPLRKIRKKVWGKVAKIRAWQSRNFKIGVKNHDQTRDELIEIARRIDAGSISGRAIERIYFDDAETFFRNIKVKQKYRNKVAAAMHKAAVALHAEGGIDDDYLREMDVACFTDCWRRWSAGNTKKPL